MAAADSFSVASTSWSIAVLVEVAGLIESFVFTDTKSREGKKCVLKNKAKKTAYCSLQRAHFFQNNLELFKDLL